MKILLKLTALFIFGFYACNTPQQESNDNKQETPKALQEKSYESGFSKRGDDDLVEDLYDELVDKTPILKELEEQIEDLHKSQQDSIGSFNKYNTKNNRYYNAANAHLQSINDSALKQKIKLQISASLANYTKKIAGHTALLRSINTKNATLSDLHTVLKLTRTLSLMEQYQTDNFPSTKPLDQLMKKFDQVIQKADTLIKK